MDELNQYVDKLRPQAKEYNEMKSVLALYGALDGYIISYSAFKLYFDIMCSDGTSSSDELHDWLMSSSGFKKMALGTISIIALSLINNLMSDKDDKNAKEDNAKKDRIDELLKTAAKNDYIQSLAKSWPYIRDAFKGLKFFYKGLRSTLQVLNFYQINFQSMLVPLTLSIGILAASNRVFYRLTIQDKRKQYVSDNKALLKESKLLGCDYSFCEASLESLPVDQRREGVLYLSIEKNYKSQAVLRCTTKSNLGPPIEIPLNQIADIFYDANNNIIEANELTIADLKASYYQIIVAKLLANTNNPIVASTNNHSKRAEIKRKLRDNSNLPNHYMAMGSAVFSGLVDGLYTYMGILCLVTLTPGLLAVMTFSCVLFTLARVINRCTEEYEYQQELSLSKYRTEEILLEQELREAIWHAQSLNSECIDDPKSSSIHNKDDIKTFDNILSRSRKLREDIKAAIVHTPQRARLNGLRSGLYVYSAISSIIFAISALLLAMFQIALSPWFLASGVVIGLISLYGFVSLSLENNKRHLNEHDTKDEEEIIKKEFSKLQAILLKKENGSSAINSKIDDDLTYFKKIMSVKKSPQYSIQEISEIARSCFSGLGKGWKAIDFLMNSWLVTNEKGHYQENQLMASLGFLLSLLYCYSYSTKAFGKQLKPLDQADFKIIKPTSNATIHSNMFTTIQEQRAITSKSNRFFDKAEPAMPLVTTNVIPSSVIQITHTPPSPNVITAHWGLFANSNGNLAGLTDTMSIN